jgi:lysophospholipase L1-like esterase
MVALGDSITRGKGGMPMLGIHPQSWAQWVAETLALPLTNLATDGAVATDVVIGQVPCLLGPYDLGTLFIGANDARAPQLDVATFDEAVGLILDVLAEAADRVLVLSVPAELGRPHAGKDVERANHVLRWHAGRTGATLVDLSDLHGPRVMLPDSVHPTSPGMVEIADRALAALGHSERVDSGERHHPWARIDYARWYLKQVARDAWRRLAER